MQVDNFISNVFKFLLNDIENTSLAFIGICWCIKFVEIRPAVEKHFSFCRKGAKM